MLAMTDTEQLMQRISSVGRSRRRELDPKITLSEIISAMSFALDLTEDAVPGHSLRSCLLGMRLAEECGLRADQRASLYYSLLLKDIGCSSNAARMCAIVGGDDRALKAGAKLEDWTRPHKPSVAALKLLWHQAVPGTSAPARVARILKIGLNQHRNNEEMIRLRCDRGSEIMYKLGMGHLAAEAVRGLDEHWDGSGYPERRKGEAIPLLARICAVAQHLDVFATERGPEAALSILRERSGRWFDPALVKAAESLHRRRKLYAGATSTGDHEQTRVAVLDLDPATQEQLSASRIDVICEAFADVVDAKSPFTFSHSIGVALVASGIARKVGLPQERVQLVRRAALLHDLGKLRVPNSILDKHGPLNDAEWSAVREHPALTRRILERIPAFHELAAIAGEHHEKLDGSGYPDRRRAEELSLESRVIAVADVYSALTENRPYRMGSDPDTALRIMERDVPGRLDINCFEGLIASVTGSSPSRMVPVAAAAKSSLRIPLFA
jgi:putative nucleotidyltransferase with HDIG domain